MKHRQAALRRDDWRELQLIEIAHGQGPEKDDADSDVAMKKALLTHAIERFGIV